MGLVQWLLNGTGPRVELLDRESVAPPDPGPTLLRVAAEAVLLQDRAEALLAAIARHESLGRVAPRGGPLTRRFFALRAELPAQCADPRLQHLRDQLDMILYHHAMQVTTAMDFLAVEWRSATLARQVESLQGLGPAANLLDDVYHELAARAF